MALPSLLRATRTRRKEKTSLLTHRDDRKRPIRRVDIGTLHVSFFPLANPAIRQGSWESRRRRPTRRNLYLLSFDIPNFYFPLESVLIPRIPSSVILGQVNRRLGGSDHGLGSSGWRCRVHGLFELDDCLWGWGRGIVNSDCLHALGRRCPSCKGGRSGGCLYALDVCFGGSKGRRDLPEQQGDVDEKEHCDGNHGDVVMMMELVK